MAEFAFASDFDRFNADTTRYSPHNALVLADAARIVYRDGAAIEAGIAARWATSDVHFADKNGTQALVVGTANAILVAFRGTEPKVLKDWMTDANIKQAPGPKGQVHEGFWTALHHVWDGVVQHVKRFQSRDQSLWFTGHSLGAALATLAVAKLRLEANRPVNGLYTFGQPRTGDAEFAAAFNADFERYCFRFVNNNDVVTRVPPRALGYCDVGRVLYFDSDGNLQHDVSHWNRFVDRLKGRIEEFGHLGLDGIEDHAMDGYADLLKRNLTVMPSW